MRTLNFGETVYIDEVFINNIDNKHYIAKEEINACQGCVAQCEDELCLSLPRCTGLIFKLHPVGNEK